MYKDLIPFIPAWNHPGGVLKETERKNWLTFFLYLYFQNTLLPHRIRRLQLRAGGPCLKRLLYHSVLHYFTVRNRQNTKIIVTMLLLLNISSEPLNNSCWLHLKTGCTCSSSASRGCSLPKHYTFCHQYAFNITANTETLVHCDSCSSTCPRAAEQNCSNSSAPLLSFWMEQKLKPPSSTVLRLKSIYYLSAGSW